MKNRGIGFGNVMFLGVIISLFAGCNPGLTPDAPSPLVDENGNYIITVNTVGMGGRSILPGDAPLYAEKYEIVCYDGTNFYSGHAKSDMNLTVSLPEGTYDMLLLAGSDTYVLLGTGWLPDQAIGPDTGSVTITVNPLTIVDTEMSFNDGTTTAPPTPTGTPPIPTFGSSPTTIPTLTTIFTLHNMEALEEASLAASVPDIYDSNGIGFDNAKVVLKYYDDTHKLLNPNFEQASLTSDGGTSASKTLTFATLTPSGGTDWSAVVYLDLKYFPFSQTTTPIVGHKWSIMNGLGGKASNGGVKVISGSGGTITIDIFNDF
jgi:hypothetical protein